MSGASGVNGRERKQNRGGQKVGLLCEEQGELREGTTLQLRFKTANMYNK